MTKEYIKEVLVTNKQIKEYCKKLAQQITEEYRNEVVTLLCVLKGSVPFAVELMKYLAKEKVEIEYIRASSYESQSGVMESTGNVTLSCQTFETVEHKNVIILEDILDTGRTLLEIKKYIKKQNPKSLKIATLVDKPERRQVDIVADYVGFVIPNEFIIGFGLDYDEKFRGLGDIVIPYPEKL